MKTQQNKTALITGASSGIGKELAFLHSKRGGDLIIIARSEEKLKQMAAELMQQYGNNVLVIAKDLTGENAAQEVYDEVKAKNITVDYLINNAGFGGIGKFYERSIKDDTAMIQLNIVALTQLTHLFLNDFVDRNSGRILNVSSTASLMPGPLQAVYFATKAYVTSFSNAIAEELKNTKVTVTTLMPGPTKTDFGSRSGMDKTELFENTTSPEIVAEDGYEAMLNGDLNMISGVELSQRIMLKLLPFVPKKLVLEMIKKRQTETK